MPSKFRRPWTFGWSVLPVARVAFAAILFVPAAAAPAAAAELPAPLKSVAKTLRAERAVERICLSHDTPRARRGQAVTRYRAPIAGFLTVRGTAARGSDWDLAIYDAASGRGLAASQGWRSREVAQAWVRAGQRIAVAGCRRSGRDRSFRVRMSLLAVEPPADGGTASLVRVDVASEEAFERLEALQLNVTHEVQEGHADVIIGPGDAAKLRQAGFTFRTRYADLGAKFLRDRRSEAAYARRVGGRSATPTGRTTYRTYEDFGAELKQIVADYPALARPLVLPQPSFQGRELSGVEIAAGVGGRDGRPVALIVALHHAREWPSAEAAMEFAHELVRGYGADPRITRLLDRTRVVIVPLVNPDGYISSRTTSLVDPSSTLYDNGIDVPLPLFGNLNTFEAVAPPGGLLSFRRKNCGGAIPSGLVPCELQYGVDPNRNYGQFWGGPGSSGDPLSQAYRGTGPWSEPETQAIHEYSQRTNVVSLATLHNVAALVLRPPGTSDGGRAPDEDLLREYGDRMADSTGYTSQYGFQLYDTSGTTEDWNYAAAGTFGYTIELGPKDGEFHMPYQVGFIDEWTGTGDRAGRGMREALLVLAESATDPRVASVIEGRAPAGRTLRLRKDFTTSTKETCSLRTTGGTFEIGAVPCQGETIPAREIPDFLEYTTTVRPDGTYEWTVTPSTRPFVAKAGGRETWTLDCLSGGDVRETRQVSVERGQRVTVDVPCGGTLPPRADGRPGAGAPGKSAAKKKLSAKKRKALKRCLKKARRLKGAKKRAAAKKRCHRKARAKKKQRR